MMAFFFLLIGLGLTVVAFLQFVRIGWNLWLAILVSLVPLASCYFFGLFGLLFSALFVGALYKIQ